MLDFDGGSDGHRGQYNAMLCALFDARHAPFGPAVLVDPRPVLTPQIEHAPVRFFTTCLIRACLGRRTVGLLLRPLPSLYGASPRLRLKRAGLRLLRRLSKAQVLTIVPFEIDTDLSSIAHGWIHDLQNWDFGRGTNQDEVAGQCLTADLETRAAGRKICCAIGGQSREKGFDRFCAMWNSKPELRNRFLFAYGGKVTADCAAEAESFARSGGCAFDRFISDGELRGLFQAADLVWCAYDPGYDQASGILGRAMQHGVPVVVRSGSVVEKLCRLAAHPFLLEADVATTDRHSLPEPMPLTLAQERARRHERESMTTLTRALGLEADCGASQGTDRA